MKPQVKYSSAAIRDLDRVWMGVYEACHDFDTTARYLDGLLDKVEAKAAFPKSGSPLYYQNSFTGYYFVVFKAYMAFYRVEDDIMFVDRVLFGRSDYMRVLHLQAEDVEE
ncbi:MAG: type II toxin-antitoxin system RelE/ParE family toxin [Lachnospiraceae bacterium]|nr:type II toxin-antitoxin system RelE/ParE family toxin [Lachnospiraceae bacterium]